MLPITFYPESDIFGPPEQDTVVSLIFRLTSADRSFVSICYDSYLIQSSVATRNVYVVVLIASAGSVIFENIQNSGTGEKSKSIRYNTLRKAIRTRNPQIRTNTHGYGRLRIRYDSLWIDTNDLSTSTPV